MSSRNAVASLRRLGLPNYQARVFVALQQLGIGTAQEISDVSDVPRSQVYGAADELADRGLIEVIESSPKQYRSVSLETAREQLTSRLKHERDRAFENLAEIRTPPTDQEMTHPVSTLRGRQPIDDRISELIETATLNIVFVAPEERSLSEKIETMLRNQANNGVAVTVVTAGESGLTRLESDSVTVIVMGDDNPADFAGRALLVDETKVLLSVLTDDGTVREEAMWTAGSNIGRILAQFMQSGIESGMDRNPSQ